MSQFLVTKQDPAKKQDKMLLLGSFHIYFLGIFSTQKCKNKKSGFVLTFVFGGSRPFYPSEYIVQKPLY